MPTVNDLVRLLPEDFPSSGRSTLINGKVLEISNEVLTIKTFADEFTTEEFVFTLPSDPSIRPCCVTRTSSGVITIWMILL